MAQWRDGFDLSQHRTGLPWTGGRREALRRVSIADRLAKPRPPRERVPFGVEPAKAGVGRRLRMPKDSRSARCRPGVRAATITTAIRVCRGPMGPVELQRGRGRGRDGPHVRRRAAMTKLASLLLDALGTSLTFGVPPLTICAIGFGSHRRHPCRRSTLRRSPHDPLTARVERREAANRGPQENRQKNASSRVTLERAWIAPCLTRTRANDPRRASWMNARPETVAESLLAPGLTPGARSAHSASTDAIC